MRLSPLVERVPVHLRVVGVVEPQRTLEADDLPGAEGAHVRAPVPAGAVALASMHHPLCKRWRHSGVGASVAREGY